MRGHVTPEKRDSVERACGAWCSVTAMFFFFSNRVGLIGSLVVSALLTLVLLAFCGVL